ncbi:MAG TPA: hypothetical protein VF622_04725 [Segetibacter sp.]|jgi:hypothetical protein
MQSLSTFLNQRIQQLEHRKMMIPRYVERPESFLGKKDFSLSDLPKIEQDLKECKFALWAIESRKKGKPITTTKDGLYWNEESAKEMMICDKCGSEGWIYLLKGGVKKCNKC